MLDSWQKQPCPSVCPAIASAYKYEGLVLGWRREDMEEDDAIEASMYFLLLFYPYSGGDREGTATRGMLGSSTC